MSVTVNCTTDLPVTTIEWLDGNGTLMTSDTQSFLTIRIDKISTIQQITCIINSPFGNQNKSLTLSALLVLATNSDSSSTVNIAIAVTMCLVSAIALCLFGLALILVAWKR